MKGSGDSRWLIRGSIASFCLRGKNTGEAFFHGKAKIMKRDDAIKFEAHLCLSSNIFSVEYGMYLSLAVYTLDENTTSSAKQPKNIDEKDKEIYEKIRLVVLPGLGEAPRWSWRVNCPNSNITI